MASINSASSSSYVSSLYNSANIISGLASGMDTEGMIEQLVSSYNTKIQQLTNKATKLEWKQEAYRSIISKMYAFSNKYASYASSTNLLSTSFFNNARVVSTLGKYADLVSATGRTDSDIVLNKVDQMATAARYVTYGNMIGSGNSSSITASGAVDLDADMTVGTLSGSLSLTYGNQTISLIFDENNDQYTSVEELAAGIREKLANETITYSGGSGSAKASDRIDVSVDSDGNITFKDKSGAGNSVYISDASGTIGEELNLKGVTSSDKLAKITTSNDNFTKQVNIAEQMSGKSFNIALDGIVRNITGPEIRKNGDGSYTLTDAYGETYDVDATEVGNKYAELLNNSVQNAFGNKITVTNESSDGSKLQLQFKTSEDSELLINSSAGAALKIGSTASNYLNTSKTLGELLGEEGLKKLDRDADGKYAFKINGVTVGSYDADTKLSTIMNDINSNSDAGVKVSYSKTTRSFVFEAKETGSQGKIEFGDGLAQAMFGVTASGSDKVYEAFKDLDWSKSPYEEIRGIKFDLPDVSYSTYITKDMTMEEVADKLTDFFSSYEYTFSYDDTTGQIVAHDKYGEKLDLKVLDPLDGDKELEYKNSVSYTPGQDAKFTVTVNGIKKEMTRSSNTVDIDGLNITFKDTFGPEEGEKDSTANVTFKVSTDSDKIINAIKDMVNDYNEMMAEIKSAYATLPYQSSTGAFQDYEPLSDEDKATMSESAIQAYEAKAKQGILFGDTNLRNLYQRMQSAFSPTGSDNDVLRKMGLTMGFSTSDGTSYLTLDESKLREMLDSDPDAVMNVFTKTAESGGTSGIMEGLKTQLDRYGATTGATKGILVQQAGTPLSSLSLLDNQWQKQIDNLGTQIEKWQDKLSGRVDYYTKMFTRMETLINQLNSQSSTLASLMGS